MCGDYCSQRDPELITEANGNAQKGILVYPVMWTELECHVGLITSCFPAVNQVFRELIIGDTSMQNSLRTLQAAPGMLSVDSSMEQGLKDGDVEGRGVVISSAAVGEA